MNWGVVAFIDALGVKGIWKRRDAAAVLDSFDGVKRLAAQLKDRVERADGGDLWESLSVTVAHFSDSIGIAVTLPSPKIETGTPEFAEFYDSTRRYMLLRHVVMFLSELVGRAALGPVPLLYRGCISVGDMVVRGQSFIGDGVDAAGEMFESCDGAFVFLTPSAAEIFTNRHAYLRIGHPPYFVPYDVPMKDGRVLATLTINPLLLLAPAERPAVAAAFAREFGDIGGQPEHVRSKAMNTMKYLADLQSWQW